MNICGRGIDRRSLHCSVFELRFRKSFMRRSTTLAKWEIWLRGIIAAAVSGGANGVVTGFAAIGIDPNHFNLDAGFHHTVTIGGVSAAISAILGVALYLRQSPLPSPGEPQQPASS
jgi:hypothetical protein